MPTAREIETEAERQRAELNDTLEALRERMTPGEIVDQAMAFARGHGGGEFVQNLGRQVRNSPLPVALVATGLAWLMFSPRRPPPPAPSIVPEPTPYAGATSAPPRTGSHSTGASGISSAARDAAGTASSAAQAAADKARGAYSSVGSGVGSAASAARDAAGSAYGAAGDAAGRAAGAASSAADSVRRGAHDLGARAQDLGDRASDLGRGAYDAATGAYDRATEVGRDTYDRASELGHEAYARARSVGGSIADQASQAQAGLMRIVREQPLVVGAVGLALGALIGAAMPRSRTEDELMGDTADEMKQAASEAVRSYYGEAKEAVGRVAERVRDEAEEQGLTTGSAKGAAEGLARDLGERARDLGDKASELGDKVAAVAGAAKESTREELDHAKEKLAGDVDKVAEKSDGTRGDDRRDDERREKATVGPGGPGTAGATHFASPGVAQPPTSPAAGPTGGRPGQPGRRA